MALWLTAPAASGKVTACSAFGPNHDGSFDFQQYATATDRRGCLSELKTKSRSVWDVVNAKRSLWEKLSGDVSATTLYAVLLEQGYLDKLASEREASSPPCASVLDAPSNTLTDKQVARCIEAYKLAFPRGWQSIQPYSWDFFKAKDALYSGVDGLHLGLCYEFGFSLGRMGPIDCMVTLRKAQPQVYDKYFRTARLRPAITPVRTRAAGREPACAAFFKVEWGDALWKEAAPDSNGILWEGVKRFRPNSQYGALAKTCLDAIQQRHPLAWTILTTWQQGNLWPPLADEDMPSSLFMQTALMAESDDACAYFRGPYDRATMDPRIWDVPGDEWEELHENRRVCTARIVAKGGPALAKLNWQGFKDGYARLDEITTGSAMGGSTSPTGREINYALEWESPQVWTAPQTPSLSNLMLLPGSWLLSYLWIDAYSGYGLSSAIVISWWAWLTFLRLSWCIPARWVGFYNPEHFRFWSYLWPWRPFFRPLLPLFTWLREFHHGKMATAKWTPLLETMTLLYRPGLILLGRLRWLGLPLFQPVGIEGSGRHLAMIAAPGSGKTTLLMSMLALHRGTCFVVDCDAQMINAVGRRLGSGGRGIFGKGNDVRLLDPYGASKTFPGSSWNAIWELRRFVEEHGRDSAVGFAQTMAEALIKGGEGQNAWVQKDARAFLKGLILYVAFYEPPEHQNLVRLRQLLSQGMETEHEDDDGFRSLLLRMKRISDFGGAISNAAGVMESSHGSDGKNHPRADAVEQTQWLDLPQVAAICRRSDFDLHDLKKGKLCLFVSAPVTDLQTKLAGYFRLLTMLTMEAFQRLETVSLKNPCLFALDEMPALGHIEVIQTAAPVFRKYGVRLLCIAQDIERLKAVYPHGWGGFLGTAEAVIWMGLEHKETLAYLSELLSTATRNEKAEGGGVFSKVPARSHKTERPLLYPAQIRELLDPQRGNIIVTRFGKRPLRLKNVPYYTEMPVCFYDADRKFSETLGRKIGRMVFRALVPGDDRHAVEPDSAPDNTTASEGSPFAASQAEPPPHSHANSERPREKSRSEESAETRSRDAASPEDTAKQGASDQGQQVDAEFEEAFRACFEEHHGAYAHPRIRRQVWAGFAPYLAQGGDFDALQLRFEDWLISELEPKARAEHVIVFFEDWIKHARDNG